MPELSGPIQHVEIVQWLWLIPALPFLGALINAFYSSGLWGKALDTLRIALADEDKPRPKPQPRVLASESFVGNVAISAMVLAFGVVVFALWTLLQHPPGERFLLTHCWQMVRFGQLDINFDFAIDPLSVLMCLIITGVGSLIHVYASSYMEGDPDYWRFFAWLNLFVFSMLLLVLGDNFFVMFFGWEGVGLCSYGLIGFWWRDYKKASAGMKAFVTNRVGDFGFVMGAALLFWGLGGAWSPEGDYTSDLAPRFNAVAVKAEGEGAEEGHETAKNGKVAKTPEQKGAAAAEAKAEAEADAKAAIEGKEAKEAKEKSNVKATQGKGYLTLTSLPGAFVYLDDSHTPMLKPDGTPLRSPFTHVEIAGGVHSFRIAPDDGWNFGDDKTKRQLTIEQGVQDNSVVTHVAMGNEKEVALTSFGPTVTFRNLRDQFVSADAKGERPALDTLLGKKAWGRMGVICLACLLLFLGACGKSAQVPLYVWLPDAMAGPTPVSALIHAATMVTAGVYMIARLNFLFALSPTASGVIAFTGAFTALFAATIGFFQYDIKKVLAYSTVSQLGFMFIGVGVGAYWAGVFHLMTHAFFKACLFLGAGSVIHGMHAVEHDEAASQDMRNMGGLKKPMPKTALTYFVACLAITAAPIPFFAGFWSKDEILYRAWTSHNIGFMPTALVYAMGLVAAVGTSFYMWRSYYLTFEGKPRKKEVLTKVHESPARITGVLQILAVLAAVSGAIFGLSSHLIGGTGSPLLEEWLEPVMEHAKVEFAEPGLGTEYGLMALSVGLALASWAFARFKYGDGRGKGWDTAEQRVPGFQLLSNKYYVDELYQVTIIAAVLRLRLVLAQMDKWVVDGIVNGVGVITRVVAWINGTIDAKIVDGAVNFVAEGTLKAGHKLRGLQTGRIQNYIYGALGGVAFFAIVQYFLSYNK
jgi:NADH-quinone oxidoreductase subunit L